MQKQSNQTYLVFISFMLVAFRPDAQTIAAFVASVVLYAFLEWLMAQDADRFSQIDAEIKALKGKIHDLQLAKGLGR